MASSQRALCFASLWQALPVQAQELDWAKRAGGTGSDNGRAIARDDAGNSYVIEVFTGTAT